MLSFLVLSEGFSQRGKSNPLNGLRSRLVRPPFCRNKLPRRFRSRGFAPSLSVNPIGSSRAVPFATSPVSAIPPTIVRVEAAGWAQPLAQPETWRCSEPSSKPLYSFAISAAILRAGMCPDAHSGAPGQAEIACLGSSGEVTKPSASACFSSACACAAVPQIATSVRLGAGLMSSTPSFDALSANVFSGLAVVWPKGRAMPSATRLSRRLVIPISDAPSTPSSSGLSRGSAG